jgi:thiol-disulfide isomerase/thioredoxin
MKYICLLSLLFVLSFTAVRAQEVKSWKITDVRKEINNSDSVIVVNFWATFCKPCIHELPYMQQISSKYNVKMLLVSLDLPSEFPKKIEDFIKENKYTARVVWLNELNADYFCPVIDKKWSGSIPTTYFYNKKTGYKKLVEQEMSAQRYETELQNALKN